MNAPRFLLASAALVAYAGCSQGAYVPPSTDSAPGSADAGSRADATEEGADATSATCSDPSEPGCDCDPSGQLAASPLLVDDLASDRGQVEPAPGFDASAWSFAEGAYRQQALEEDRDDASFTVLDEPVDDLLAQVTAASTDITGDLRQIFLTARASSSTSDYEAVACGIELDLRGERKATTSAAVLSGAPAEVATERRDTREYSGVAPDQEFDIRMELSGDEMRCRVTVDGDSTFVQVGGFGEGAGSVGVHTRETEALFRDLYVCGLP